MKKKLLLLIPTLIFASCSNGKSMKDDTVAERYNRILKSTNLTMDISPL